MPNTKQTQLWQRIERDATAAGQSPGEYMRRNPERYVAYQDAAAKRSWVTAATRPCMTGTKPKSGNACPTHPRGPTAALIAPKKGHSHPMRWWNCNAKPRRLVSI